MQRTLTALASLSLIFLVSVREARSQDCDFYLREVAFALERFEVEQEALNKKIRAYENWRRAYTVARCAELVELHWAAGECAKIVAKLTESFFELRMREENFNVAVSQLTQHAAVAERKNCLGDSESADASSGDDPAPDADMNRVLGCDAVAAHLTTSDQNAGEIRLLDDSGVARDDVAIVDQDAATRFIEQSKDCPKEDSPSTLYVFCYCQDFKAHKGEACPWYSSPFSCDQGGNQPHDLKKKTEKVLANAKKNCDAAKASGSTTYMGGSSQPCQPRKFLYLPYAKGQTPPKIAAPPRPY